VDFIILVATVSLVKKFVPLFALSVGWILDLDPLRSRVVVAVAVLCHNPFKILFANHPEEVDAVPIHVIGIQQRRIASLYDQLCSVVLSA
jgi:hypothetical protein